MLWPALLPFDYISVCVFERHFSAHSLDGSAHFSKLLLLLLLLFILNRQHKYKQFVLASNYTSIQLVYIAITWAQATLKWLFSHPRARE